MEAKLRRISKSPNFINFIAIYSLLLRDHWCLCFFFLLQDVKIAMCEPSPCGIVIL